MNVKDLKDKIVTKLEACLPIELVNEIKDLHAKLAENVVPQVQAAEPAATTGKEVKTVDGKVLSFDGDLALGVKVSEVTPSGVVDAQDGEYTLETGEVIEITGGLVTEIAPGGEKEAEPTQPTMNPEMQAQMDAQKSEINDLKTRLESVTKQNLDLAAALKKILETPVEVKQSKHEEVDLDKMSPLERRRYLKSL